MATDKQVKLEQNEFYQPTEADKELTGFVVDHCQRWRDYRDVNFLPDWLEYERIFRGQWAGLQRDLLNQLLQGVRGMSLAEFDRAFKRAVGEEHRWPAFKIIAYYLLAKQGPVHIAETGCAREENNWSGDGQSTQVWNWIIQRTGGSAISFDINPKAVAYAKSVAPLVDVRCIDSVQGLRT